MSQSSTISNATTQQTITHNAPAGNKYASIKHAGRTLLENNFSGFLKGTSHAIIPPIFINEYPEQVDKDGKISPGPKFTQTDLQDLYNNKVGEDHEICVFRRFEEVLGTSLPDASSLVKTCHLILKGFRLMKYKVEALLDENPGLSQMFQEETHYQKRKGLWKN